MLRDRLLEDLSIGSLHSINLILPRPVLSNYSLVLWFGEVELLELIRLIVWSDVEDILPALPSAEVHSSDGVLVGVVLSVDAGVSKEVLAGACVRENGKKKVSLVSRSSKILKIGVLRRTFETSVETTNQVGRHKDLLCEFLIVLVIY